MTCKNGRGLAVSTETDVFGKMIAGPLVHTDDWSVCECNVIVYKLSELITFLKVAMTA